MDSVVIALIGLAIVLGGVALGIALPIASWFRTTRALRTAEQALARAERLTQLVEQLRAERAPGSDAPVWEVREAPSGPAPEQPLDRRPTDVAAAASAEVEKPVAAAHAPAAPLEVSVAPAGQAPGPPVAASPPQPDGSGASAPPRVAPAQPAAAAPAAADLPSLEQRIGQRWLLYAGVAALVLGASYIVKLAFENDWITPGMRVLLSAGGGVALIGLGLRFAIRGLPVFGHGLAGAGVVIVYVAIYAALQLYGLIDRSTAFGWMALTTVVAAGIADRRSAQLLALIALVGGFATPALVGGDRAAYLTLFTHLSVLIAGAVFLARRHDWPLVTLTAFALTVFSFSTWAVTSYSPARYVGVQAFLTLWLGLLLAAIARPARAAGGRVASDARPASAASLAGVTAIVGLLAPVLFHLASLVNLQRHTQALLVYFIVATLCGILYSADGRRPWARLAIWVAVWVPLIGWLSTRGRPAGALATIVALFGLHLMSELRGLLRDPRRLGPLETTLLHLNGLGLVAGLLVLRPSWDTHGMAAAVAWVGACYVALTLAVRRRHESAPLHYLALASACFAGALALRFEGAWVTLGWAVEGALLVWLGLGERRPWLRVGGWGLVVLGTWHGLDELTLPAGAAMLPWLNARALSLWAIAGLLGWLASRYAARGPELPGNGRLTVGASIVAACVLALVVITEQINGSFGMYAWQRETAAGPMAAGAADLARQVTVSLVWAGYAVGLLVIGIARRYPPVRYLAITLLLVTVTKVLVVDLAQLDRIYRIASVIGLGVCLLLASFLYQRFLGNSAPQAGSSRDA